MINFKKLFLLLCCLPFATNLQADETVIYTPAQTVEKLNDSNTLLTVRFDEKKFNLAYQAFIYNGKVEDAYDVAEAAVKSNPQSVIWLERLAQTATWTNRTSIALRTYVQLILKFNQTKFIDPAITLAEQLKRDDMLVTLYQGLLKQHPNNLRYINGLASAYTAIGDTNKALSLLKHYYQQLKDPQLLYHLSQIAAADKNTELATQSLNDYEKIKDPSIETSLTQEALSLEVNNIERAYESLNRVKMNPDIHHETYWRDLASLAWITNHPDTAKFAYHKLYQAKQIKEEGLRRLYIILSAEQSPEALSVAKYAWLTYQSEFAFFAISQLAPLYQQWETFALLYTQPLNKQNQAMLRQRPAYHYGFATLLSMTGQADTGSRYLLQSTLKNPTDEMQYTYFNFIQNVYFNDYQNHPAPYYHAAMRGLANHALRNNAWTLSYMTALAQSNDIMHAMRLFSVLPQDYPSLIEYQSLLSSLTSAMNWQRASARLMNQLWYTLNQLPPSAVLYDTDYLTKYTELSARVNPVGITTPLAYYLANNRYNPIPLLNLAFERNNVALADVIAQHYPHLPNWAVLKLALFHQDKQTMHRLVTRVPDALPLSDRVSAATNAGQIHLAQQLAFEGLQQSPNPELYEQFKTLMTEYADTLNPKTEYEQFGNLQGPRQILTGQWHENGWMIEPLLSYWNPYSNNAGNISAGRYIEKIESLSVTSSRESTQLKAMIGYHEAFYNSQNALLSYNIQLNQQSRVGGKIAYNQRSTLDVPMLIAGSQDEFILNSQYQLSARDVVQTQLQYQRYYLQDRTQLGSGAIANVGYNHQILLAYPDLSLSWNTDIDRFKQYNSYLGTQINSIFPKGTTINTHSFVPDNFWQTSLSVNIGNTVQENYTKILKPYANAGLIYNSTAGYGNEFDAGLKTAVLGHDQLSFYYTRSSVNSGQSQTNFLVGCSYVYYLS